MKYSQILIYILTVILSISISYAKDKYFGNRTAVMWEYEEWNVNNSSWSDNPFDVRTTVTFKHQDSNETRTTEMFYEGNDKWKFRFTGIKTGKWTFTTSSTDSELDGYKGTVTVKPNSNENIHGFLTNREGIFDMDTTRQILWQYTMAGGIGSFWGFYDRGGEEGPPYPNPERLSTHYTFWHKNKRFLLDMERANELTNGYALKNASNTNYVFYKKNTSSIQINLSEMDSPQSAVAVDTKKKYTEIDLGILSPTKHTLSLAMSSDWAIAVGKFKNND